MSILGRELTDSERDKLERIVRSRTAQARLVDHAKIVLAAASGRRKADVCRALGKDKHTVTTWIERFREAGIEGLHDHPRTGAPCHFTPEQKAEVIAAALQNPQKLGLPFARWTHDRLTAYIHEVKHIPISRTRIAEILRAEGLRWHKEETWYGERVDPAFAEKRGRWSVLTSNRTRRRPSSV